MMYDSFLHTQTQQLPVSVFSPQHEPFNIAQIVSLHGKVY